MWKTCLLSRVKDVENPVGIFSTELKAYKVRGVKWAMKGGGQVESQLGDGKKTCAAGSQEDEEQRYKRTVDDAEWEEILNDTVYPKYNHRRPHSRKCSCNRISWMALNTNLICWVSVAQV